MNGLKVGTKNSVHIDILLKHLYSSFSLILQNSKTAGQSIEFNPILDFVNNVTIIIT